MSSNGFVSYVQMFRWDDTPLDFRWAVILAETASEVIMEQQKTIAIDTTTMPWEERYQAALGKSNFRKLLLQDPDTGMEIRLLRYPAGFTATWHTHSCAHGMYVLEGTLVTHLGSYGPGGFVWFPEGMLMEHGATASTDVVMLFITNKKFDIHFVEKK